MRIASGKVVDGHVEYEGDLPDGSEVTLLAYEPEDTFEASEELKAVLLKSMAQADRGETFPIEQLFQEMLSRE